MEIGDVRFGGGNENGSDNWEPGASDWAWLWRLVRMRERRDQGHFSEFAMPLAARVFAVVSSAMAIATISTSSPMTVYFQLFLQARRCRGPRFI
jgi:hypothetical protein